MNRLRAWFLAWETKVACQAGAVPGGPSLTSLSRMLCIFITCASGASRVFSTQPTLSFSSATSHHSPSFLPVG